VQVRDDAGIARIVFLDFENDLHQVGADVGNLGKNAAGNTQRGRAERFAKCKADEAWPRIVSGDKQQDEEHHQQFDANQHHADNSCRLRAEFDRWDTVCRARPANAVRELREGIHPDAEPGDSVASANSNQAEEQNDGKRGAGPLIRNGRQDAEIQDDNDSNEQPEKEKEFALR